MEIKFRKSELVDIINEDIDRLAARTYSEEGVSLFDGIRVKSRDKGVQGRMLEERSVRLRDLLAFCLSDKEAEDVMEDGKAVDTCLVYDIVVENCPKAPSASSLKVMLRKYLTEGTLYDWYTKHGIVSSITYEDVEAQEIKLVCMLRQGFTKRPLQPFGPRK